MEQRKRNFGLYQTDQGITMTTRIVVILSHHIAQNNFIFSISTFPMRQDILFISNLKMKNQIPKGKRVLPKFTQQQGDRTGASTVVLSAHYNVTSHVLWWHQGEVP